MRFIALIMTTLILLGCTKTEDQTNLYDLPVELKDCTVHQIATKDGKWSATVVRCPNSSTSSTYKSGKSTRTVTVVD